MRNIQSIDILYIAIGIAFLMLCFCSFSSKEKAIKFMGIANGYKDKLDEYDWDKTIKRYKLSLVIIILALITSILAINYFA